MFKTVALYTLVEHQYGLRRLIRAEERVDTCPDSVWLSDYIKDCYLARSSWPTPDHHLPLLLCDEPRQAGSPALYSHAYIGRWIPFSLSFLHRRVNSHAAQILALDSWSRKWHYDKGLVLSWSLTKCLPSYTLTTCQHPGRRELWVQIPVLGKTDSGLHCVRIQDITVCVD